MSVISYNVPNDVQRMIIGVQGEHNVREFLFDVTEWRQITGDIGSAEMVVQRAGDSSPYATVITMHDENTVSWIPTEADTAKAGAGKLQLMWIADGQTVKTKIFDMKVDPALDYQLPDSSLDPWASWIPDVINAGVAAKNAAGSISDLTAKTNLLQTEIDELIAPSGEAPSAAEVTDARIGVDATVYPTLGEAIRGQVGELKSVINTMVYQDANLQSLWQVGGLGSNGENYNRATSIRTKDRLPIGDYYAIVTGSELTSGYLCLYADTSGYALHRYSISGNKEYARSALLEAYPTALYFRIEIGQCEGNVGAYNRVELISADPIGDVTEQLTQAHNNLVDKTDAVNSLVNYDYDTPADLSANSSASDSSSTRIGVKRNRTIIELSGGGSTSFARIKLNGGVTRTNGTTEVDAWTGIQLTPGEKYRAVMQLISGSSELFANPSIGVSIYPEGTHSSLGTFQCINDRYIREFIAPSTPVNVVIAVNAGTTFDDTKLCVFLQKVMAEDLTAYVERETKNINRFATQWQPGGLGSTGENYDRPTSIRTMNYWALDNILRISVAGTINLCLYSANNAASFLARYSYTDTTVTYDEMIARQPNAAYFRIELGSVGGEISAYSNVIVVGREYACGLERQDHAYDKALVFGQQRTSSEQYGECAFRAMIVSDVHAEAGRFGNTIALMDKWGFGRFDALINCGDTVQAIQSNGIAWHDIMLPFIGVPYVNVVGNHDAYESLGVLTDKASTYQTVIAPIAGQEGIVQPANAQSNSLCYYYMDINSKVRIIALDCMYWDSAEAQWLEDTLAGANTAGLAVICVSHYGFTAQYGVSVPSLWREVGGFPGDGINISAAEKVRDFIAGGGTFVCWLVGHSHGDNLYKLTAEYNDQLVVTFPSLAQRASTLLKGTDPDSYNYLCATYMALDDFNHTVRFMRIGANIDTWGVQHTGLVLDYQNRTLVTAW